MNKPPLGQLEKVPLRDFWESEAGEFTPWLADHINILGDTIGMILEVEALEKEVGPFRADLLCKDTVSGKWVLIENQLERTDHLHLGQLLTYAAGLNAVKIVWIADHFTEEHRATLDWLNEITDNSFDFFGLEVELWRIGDSPMAAKFNIVSKPNDWIRSISGAVKQLQSENLSETRKLQLDYWTRFRELLLESKSVVRPTKPLPQHWMYLAIGRSYFKLMAKVNTWDKLIAVSLVMDGPDAKAHFHLLHRKKEEFENSLGADLNWRELPENKESQVTIEQESDPTDRTRWDEQHSWMKENLENFFLRFSQPIKKLNAEDFQPEI